MLAAAKRYLRRQFYLYWPQMGRLARVTTYFAAVDLLLLAIWSVSLLVEPGGSGSLIGWVKFLAYVTACLAAVLGLRWVRRKLMWRLRNRLIVTYVFIGVIPVILLLTIGLITAYLFAWQFATYVATSDFRTEIATLGALNNRVALEMADRMARGAAPSEGLLQQASGREPIYPDREITAWYRGKAVVLPKSARAAAPPPNGAKEVRTFVVDGGRLLLRVADTVAAGKDNLVLVSNVPLDEKLLARVGAQLGEVSLSMFSANPKEARNRKGEKNRPEIVIGDERLDIKVDAATDTPAAVKAGKLPPPANRFDREITGGSLLKVLDWKSGKERTALLAVVTRPSLLYDRLFRTVGRSATFIVAVLVVVVVLFGVIELLALFIGVRLTRTVTRSVAALYRGTQQVNRGDFTHRIEIRSEDQLAALESSFNSMTTSLERLMQEQKEKQRLENELVIAQEVQAQLFPRETADVPTLELHGICRPARTVSGDYYDFLLLESDKVALAVGDVSGKGISAALLMATIHSAVRAYSLEAAVVPALSASVAGGAGTGYHGSALAYANGDLSPSALISLLNRQLFRSTPSEKYATVFFSTYDGRSRVLNYCNAGHLPPLVLHTDGTITRLDVGGTVVGLFDSVPFDETQVALSPGDIFFAYSDGITEPENDFGEFGEQRLTELVRENRHLPLARISDLVMSAVLDWIGGGEQPDDITLVLARPR